MTNQQASKRKWYRRPWVIAMMVVLGLPLVALVIITFVPLDDVEVGGTSLNLELQAGKIEASNNLSTRSSFIGGVQALLDLRRVMILNVSDHVVMRKVTDCVAERLRAAPMVDTVDMFNIADCDDLPQGGRLYDFYLTLDMPKFDTSGLVIAGRQAEVTVTVNGGQSPWDSHHGCIDHLTPPIVHINFNTKLQHRSTTTGYESADARYKLMIENMADQLAESLAKNFGEWSAKYASRGDVPDEFLPSYRPVPDDLPLPDSPDLVRVISGSGLLVHNCSVWMMPTEDPVAALHDLRTRLDKSGWHLPESPDFGKDIWSRHFRATSDRGSRIYEAYQVCSDDMGGDDNAPARIVIEYRYRMTPEETRPTIDRLLAEDDPSLATLLTFDRTMTSEQSKRLTELMLNAQPAGLPTHAHMRVARHMHDKGMVEQAMAYLSDAYILAWVADAKTDEIEKLAKEITGQDNWKPDLPTASDLERLGIRALEPGDSVTMEVDLGEPVVCYQMTTAEEIDHEGPTLITATVLRSEIPEGRYTVRTAYRAFLCGGGGSGTSTRHGHSQPQSPWRWQCGIGRNELSWRTEAEEIGKDRFRVTLRASRHEPPPTSP